MERNRLVNGRFYNALDGWTVSGAAYNAGDGDDHFGVAVLSTGGDFISQTFAVPLGRLYTLHLAAKSSATLSGSEVQAVITDGNGNQATAENVAITADTWTENNFSVGLVPGTTYTLKIVNNSAGADVKIDDVFIWFIPITRAEIAARVEDRIEKFAADQELSTAVNGTKTEGDYTYSVDAGLRSVNAINPETGAPDVRYLDPEDVEAVIEKAESEILTKLRRSYALMHDITTGPVSQKYSQIGASIDQIKGAGSGNGKGGDKGRVEVRNLTRQGD